MEQNASGVTDVGRVRKKNEDHLIVDDDLGVYIVCDGLGGHASGDVASHLAAEAVHNDLAEHGDVLKKYAESSLPENRHQALSLCKSALQAACKLVYDMSRTDPQYEGMSTTCILLVIAGENAIIAHVGDSRAYLVRRGKAWQMTEDHSLGLEHLREGLITPDEVGKDVYGSVMTRCLGYYPSVDVDVLNVEMMPDDRFVMCTDGLSDYLTTKELTKLSGKTSIARLPRKLVDRANKKGGKDNITCVAVEVTGTLAGNFDAEQKIKALRQIPLFESLGFVEMTKVLNIIAMSKVDAGEAVFREGDESRNLYIILDGLAAVRKGNRTIAEMAPGDFFGEMGLIDDAPRSADVVAVEPTSLLVIRREDFNSLMYDQMQLSQKVLWSFCRVMSVRLRDTNDTLAGV